MSAGYGCSVAQYSGVLRCQGLVLVLDYSPVVNNSKPRTKLQQFEDACYLVVGTNNNWFDSFISRFLFHRKGTFYIF